MPKKISIPSYIVEKAIEQTKDVQDLNQLRTLLAVILPAKYPVIASLRLLGFWVYRRCGYRRCARLMWLIKTSLSGR